MRRSSKVLKCGSSKVGVTAQKPSFVSSVPLCETIREEVSDISKNCNLQTTNFLWDNWNIISETTVSPIPNSSFLITNSVSYVWGVDLSGSLQGAGGVGGLLAVISDDGVFAPTYDANGNISEYIDSVGNIVAHYEYDAFGNTVVEYSPLLKGGGGNAAGGLPFSFRFSTKYWDNETGLYYYGYRYYKPEWERWLNRDPIKERGGRNLYGFVGNSPLNRWDKLGLFGDGGERCIRGEWRETGEYEWDTDGINWDGDWGGGGGNSRPVREWVCLEWNKGHKDFFNDEDSCFDYTKEDHGFWTRPYNPFGTYRHFQDWETSEREAKRAIASCNMDKFQRAMHRLQDYQTHYGKGYRWWKGGHMFDGTAPDDDNEAWAKAEKDTVDMLGKEGSEDTWHGECCLKKCGKKCEYIKRSEGKCK